MNNCVRKADGPVDERVLLDMFTFHCLLYTFHKQAYPRNLQAQLLSFPVDFSVD